MAKTQKALPPFIRIGTSSFSETDWTGNFYPPKSKPSEFLTHYAKRFDTVEIDATYYAIPSYQTVDGWKSKTPEDFLISAKFPRSIVHAGEGPKPDGDIILVPDKTYPARDRFLETMERLGDRLGPLVLQFPYLARAVFKSTELFFERLDRFLADLPNGFRYAVEIRNRHWLNEKFMKLLHDHKAGLVMVDQAWMPHGEEVMEKYDPVTSDFAYIRLLGNRKEIEAITKTWDKEVIDRGESLERWSGIIADLAERKVETLIYVNNHYAGHAPTTADRLHDMIIKTISSRK